MNKLLSLFLLLGFTTKLWAQAHILYTQGYVWKIDPKKKKELLISRDQIELKTQVYVEKEGFLKFYTEAGHLIEVLGPSIFSIDKSSNLYLQYGRYRLISSQTPLRVNTQSYDLTSKNSLFYVDVFKSRYEDESEVVMVKGLGYIRAHGLKMDYEQFKIVGAQSFSQGEARRTGKINQSVFNIKKTTLQKLKRDVPSRLHTQFYYNIRNRGTYFPAPVDIIFQTFKELEEVIPEKKLTKKERIIEEIRTNVRPNYVVRRYYASPRVELKFAPEQEDRFNELFNIQATFEHRDINPIRAQSQLQRRCRNFTSSVLSSGLSRQVCTEWDIRQ